MARQGYEIEDVDFVEAPNWDSHWEAQGHSIPAEIEAAEKSKRIAEAIAPKLTGAYSRSFVIARHSGDILLGNKDWKAHFIEWGTAGTPHLHIPPWPAHATLRRAVRAAGYRLIPNPRKH